MTFECGGVTPAGFCRLCAILTLSLAMAGCSKPDDVSSRQDVSNRQDVSSRQDVLNRQSVSDAELTNRAIWEAFGGDDDEATDEYGSPAAVAARLIVPGAVKIGGGAFTMKGPVTCKSSRPGEAWVSQCTIRIAEEGQGPAEVDVNLFDEEQDYDEVQEALRTNMDRSSKPASLGIHYNYKVHDAIAPGMSGDFKAYCYQITEPRGFAVCVVNARPRVMIYAIVSPMGQGELDQRDLERAGTLGSEALLAMNQAL